MSTEEVENQLLELKTEIKSWETEFLKLNFKKPKNEDVSNAPSTIKEAYRNYWKLKNSIKATSILNKNDVWGENLNKSKSGSTLKAADGTLVKFCSKLKVKCGSKLLHENSTSKKQGLRNTSIHENCIKEPQNFKADDTLWELKESSVQNDMTNTSVKLIKFQSPLRKLTGINLISPVCSVTSKRTLPMSQDIDIDWLERCNVGINKELTVNSKDDFSSDCVAENILVSSFEACDNGSNFDNDISFSSINTKSNVKKHMSVNADGKCNDTNLEKNFPNYVNPKKESCHLPFLKKSLESIKEDDHISNDYLHENEFDSVLQPAVISQSKILISPSELQNCVNEEGIKKPGIEEGKQSKKRKVIDVDSWSGSKEYGHLKRKIASGTVNENFVRINIKKKKFSRGHHAVNVKKMKWKKWKQLKENNRQYGERVPSNSSCFKCGQLGHWSRNCTMITKESSPFSDPEVEGNLPTLEEAAELAKGATMYKKKTKVMQQNDSSSQEFSNKVMTGESTSSEVDNMHLDANETETSVCRIPVKPLYELTPTGDLIETPSEVFEALNELGYADFRKGQEKTVMRILSGLSTLVVSPTGSGKSLCYQLPAYIYAKHFRCITMVISPLVSLMEDQVSGLPSDLCAVCLHSGMTDIQRKNAIKDIDNGLAQILLVAPESIIGSSKYGTGILPSKMPPISFVCIDEVHCLSQWSHNFRPSYLQLKKVLTQKLRVKCILGLTATANHSAISDIISHLRVQGDGEFVIGHTSVPNNLHLSVSKDKDKDKALLQLLNGDRFHHCSSIIIYCIRRVETERLAALIRTCMQDQVLPEQPSKKSNSKCKNFFYWTAEAYHAGLAPSKRRSVQKRFMNGKLRVVVATVAFGMGLDKPDVRAVIHYNMPKSFESYVQEIGRAGRDGLDSQCHVFLDSEARDLNELQRYIYSNSIDRYTVRKLVNKVFPPCKCPSVNEESNQTEAQKEGTKCPKHEVAFSINETVLELDVKEENISTLLCYLELHSKQWIEILNHTYATCTIRCYGGPKQMQTLALKNLAISAAFALDKEMGKQIEKSAHYQFLLIKVASLMGWDSAAVKSELKRLEWNERKQKTGVIVEFSDLAFHVFAPGNLNDDELDNILDFLYEKVTSLEKKELQNLNSLFSLFHRYSSSHYWSCCDEVNMEYSNNIKEAVNKYFKRDEVTAEETQRCGDETTKEKNTEVDLSDVRAQVTDIISIHHDQNFTGRAIARIFHGIGSPCFPSEVWGKVRKFWRCLLHVSFNVILKVANEELKNLK